MSHLDHVTYLLDLALDDDLPEGARIAVLRAADAILTEAAENDPPVTKTDDEAWHVYCAGYDGLTAGVAERREVMLPDVLGGEPDMQWSHELLRLLARRERVRDDVMYAHLACLITPQALRRT